MANPSDKQFDVLRYHMFALPYPQSFGTSFGLSMRPNQQAPHIGIGLPSAPMRAISPQGSSSTSMAEFLKQEVPRPPTVRARMLEQRDSLLRQKQAIEEQLARTTAALEELDKHPELESLITIVQMAGI
jgi:hypothetical protein